MYTSQNRILVKRQHAISGSDTDCVRILDRGKLKLSSFPQKRLPQKKLSSTNQ